MFNDLLQDTIKELEANQLRGRSRKLKDQQHFEHAAKVILLDLWQAVHAIPTRECSIHKRSGFYSETPRYRDPLLTYRQTMAVYDGLVALGVIVETRRGHFNAETGEGQITRYIASDTFRERLNEIRGHPAITGPSHEVGETIIMRNKLDGKRVTEDYPETAETECYRSNLAKINALLLRHWADIEVRDNDISKLSERISGHPDKEPIDLSQRTLVRIFSNGSFQEGGRFYRGWWQNVPSEYRQYITLDAKRTAEVDFSQLNPHLVYQNCGKELGYEDAYSRVFDGEHRSLVKQAFNAMIMNDGFLKGCPRTLDMSGIDMGWVELRDAILAAHKPIADQFFRGIGSALQFKDSCIAERVMLDFVDWDAPILPIHDSFIVHHGYASNGDIEEVMRRAYYDEVGHHISKVDTEILSWSYRKDDDEAGEQINVDAILTADNDVSAWRERHNIWYNRMQTA